MTDLSSGGAIPVERIETTPTPPVRADDAHKGDCGRVLVIAGSRGMSGAACLCATAALRGGAGLVTVAIPEGIASLVAGYEPSYMTAAMPQDPAGCFEALAIPRLKKLAATQSTVAIGPGLGHSAGLGDLVATIWTELPQPVVIDADGLNWLARQPALLNRHVAQGPRVLTPHPGEFSRLTGLETSTIQQDRERHAVEFAQRTQTVLVLKGRGTVVTDGRRLFINKTGNSGMATGGAGDVLTGVIAALLAQGLEPFEAARLGVHVHGLAGDLAAEQVSRIGLIASDLLHHLGPAWCELGA